MRLIRLILDSDTWQEVFTTLASNRRRTIVTALGIFWGVFLLVVLLSIGYGFQNAINRQLGAIADNLCFLAPSRTELPYRGFDKGRYWQLTQSDIAMLKDQYPQIEYMSEMIQMSGYPLSSGQHVVDRARIIGLGPDYFRMQGIIFLEGRPLNKMDTEQMRHSCVLGATLKQQLFGSEPALGRTVQFAGVSYRIVGVAKQLSDNFNLFGNIGQMVMVPCEILAQQTGNPGKLDGVVICFHKETRNYPVLLEEISRKLRERNLVDPEDKQAIFSVDINSFLSTLDMTLLAVFVLVWAVGIGTLISGMVGVSNIMLVTVRERTREIGVRRAVGAQAVHIRLQLMLEALTITLSAGMAALLLASGVMIGVDSAINQIGDDIQNVIYRPLIPLEIAFATTLLIALIGVVAGLLPTQKALTIKAIDALRDE